MGIFSQKPKFKVAAPTIRTVVVPVDAGKPKKPKPPQSTPPLRDASSAPPALSSRGEGGGGGRTLGARPSAASARSSTTTPSESPRRHRPSPSPAAAAGAAASRPKKDDRKKDDRPASDRKRKLVRASAHRPSPARSDRVEFGNDSDTGDDDDWEATLTARERRKRSRPNESLHVDPDRQLAHPVLLATLRKENEEVTEGAEGTEDADAEPPRIIHAKDVASVALKCVPVLGAAEDEVAVELQYPGSRHREKYELVWGKDKIDAVKDIKTTVGHIADVYLTEEQAAPLLDPHAGVVRLLERASSEKVKDVQMFKSALDDFNQRLLAMHLDGTIAANLAAPQRPRGLPRLLAAFVLDQVYDRTVAPKVDLLRKYENGSDNVYGELLHPFVTNILVDRLQMTCGQVFVDLGSGVGNVVLQAALEVGCESWGCEMMENACNLAEAQQTEFEERCRLWGLAPGEVHLERGDFRTNARIQAALKRADVVLVNNQAFTSQLNDDLVRMFLDFKTGCKIVSLKSFVHDHKSASHNINDVGSTILDVETLTYPEGYVSWTGAGGRFCISTRR